MRNWRVRAELGNFRIIGWDIGGANTKASLVEFSGDKIVKIRSILRYFPIWIDGKERLPEVLKELKEELLKKEKADAVAITMTAELSDAYYTKREGVNHILDSVKIAFQDADAMICVVNVDAMLLTVEEARMQPLKVAAANWPATAWLVAQHVKDTILVDAGSTTTDIIPIVGGKIASIGKTDPERLVSGELIFTGALRTPIPAIIKTLTYHDKPCRVSSEKFALSADVHLVLGHISEDEYTCDTADGRNKNRKDSLARLARVICADSEMLNETEIVDLACEVYDAQLDAISAGIEQVAQTHHITDIPKHNYPVTVAGLGRKFLAAEASKKLGFTKIHDLEDTLGHQSALTAPSAAAAIMLNSSIIAARKKT
jgi:hypothetical protein